MAAPVVEATATTSEGAAGTSHTVNLPSGITAGNLLVLAISGVQTSPVTTPSGWTLHSDANLYDPAFHNLARIYWRIADGNEGSTLSMTSSADAAFGAVCYRISGATATNPLTALTYAKSNPWDGYPNPPLSSIGLQRDWLFVAGVIDYSAAQLMTGAPTGYSTMSTGVGEHNTGFHSRVTLCYKSTVVVASDDPGTFTAAAPTYWCAFTFAITPARTDFPVVVDITTGWGYGSSGSFLMPAGVTAGECLLALFAEQSNHTISAPSGWTQLFSVSGNGFAGFYKVSDGSETGAISIDMGANSYYAYITYRIAGRIGTPTASSVWTGGENDAPNPPSLDPGVGAQDILWFAVTGRNRYSYTAGPTYYLRFTTRLAATNGNLAAAHRYRNASSEDPGTFTTSTNWYPLAVTLAFPPLYEITGVGAIASAEAFGTVQLIYNREVVGVGGIASAETFGLAQVLAIKGATFPAISAFTGTHAWSVVAWAKWTARTAGRVFSVWDSAGNELAALIVDNVRSWARRAANAVANPSLEIDATGWDASPPRGGGTGVSVTRTNANGAAPGWGSYAAYLNSPTAASWLGGAYHFPFTFKAGVTYALYVWMKSVSGSTDVVWGVASMADNTDYSEIFPTITTSWVRYGPLNWTPSVDRADAAFYVLGVNAAAYQVAIDGLEVPDAAHLVAGAANDGYYHLYVMTYDGVTLRFYIDGRAAGAEVASATSLAAAGGMRAGSGYQGATPFGGSVDDVAVFDYYLSASQVAGLFVSGTTSGVDLVHDSSGSSMVLAGWQPHAYMAGYAAVDTYSTAKDLTANGGCIAIPIALEGKMALRQVSLWNTDAATARSWNWSLYYQPRQDAISNTLFRVAAGVAADAFTPGAASKRSIAAAGAPTLLGPGSYWLVIQNNHATSTFGLGSIASGPLSINRGQTKTLTVPVGATLDFTAATWTKVTAIYAAILEGDVLGLWGAY